MTLIHRRSGKSKRKARSSMSAGGAGTRGRLTRVYISHDTKIAEFLGFSVNLGNVDEMRRQSMT